MIHVHVVPERSSRIVTDEDFNKYQAVDLSLIHRLLYIHDPSFKPNQDNMNNHNQELGKTGEELAGDFLAKKGHRILHRNWNLHHGCELDIVTMKDNILHFVEVKTRTKTYEGKGGQPEEAVDYRKITHIARAILHYMAYYHLTNNYVIDVIGIVYRSDTDYDLNYIENIPIPYTQVYYSNGGRHYRR